MIRLQVIIILQNFHSLTFILLGPNNKTSDPKTTKSPAIKKEGDATGSPKKVSPKEASPKEVKSAANSSKSNQPVWRLATSSTLHQYAFSSLHFDNIYTRL